MRWSQTVRLNLANDNRKIAVNSLILASNDTINISNIATYSVSDFKNILDFGKNVLFTENILVPDALAVQRLKIGNREITENDIEALNILQNFNIDVLDFLSLVNIVYQSSNIEVLRIGKSVDISGVLITNEVSTQEINLENQNSQMKSKITHQKINFYDDDDTDVYSELNSQNLKLNSENKELLLSAGQLSFIDHDSSGSLIIDNGRIVINNNDEIFDIGTDLSGNYLNLLFNSENNKLEINPNLFELSGETNTFQWKDDLFFYNNTENLRITSDNMDSSGNNDISIILNDNSGSNLIISKELFYNENTNKDYIQFNDGQFIISNKDETHGLVIDNDTSGSFFLRLGEFSDTSDSDSKLLIDKNKINIEDSGSSFTVDKNSLEIVSDHVTIDVQSDSTNNISIYDISGSSLNIGKDFLKIENTNNGNSLTIRNDGFEYNPHISESDVIDENFEFTYSLDKSILLFGPEYKIFLHAVSLSDGKKVGVVLLVNLGSLMNSSRNTLVYRPIEYYINNRKTDHILSYDNNLTNSIIQYRRGDNVIYFKFQENVRVSISNMRIS
tara:strand:+ start:1456 stop:3135 length:1680 start_codon:yes stop_codon:yes gene_type:complete